MSKSIQEDCKLDKIRIQKKEFETKYTALIREMRKKDEEIESILKLSENPNTFKIVPSKKYDSEATAFLIASDWHIEETVKKFSVNGLNEYNPEIATDRAMSFFQNGLRLINIAQKDTKIKNIVLALLGDFISGGIHEELKEGNSMLPIDAIIFVQNIIVSGINFLLENSKLKIIIPCCVGNHPRITTKVHISTESGNSLEFFMYNNLANHFRNEKRIQFVISQGYHCYLDVYGKPIRFHHGHATRYFGGVSGIYLPINKSISQWNKAKYAVLDVIAHFHQFKDGGNFIVNGSLIGWSAYALSIKADFEVPRQAFFLFDKKRGKSLVAPIFI